MKITVGEASEASAQDVRSTPLGPVRRTDTPCPALEVAATLPGVKANTRKSGLADSIADGVYSSIVRQKKLHESHLDQFQCCERYMYQRIHTNSLFELQINY